MEEASPIKKIVKEEETWELQTDESSSKEGSGAGLVLTPPNGGEPMQYALIFKAMNNEAEYEALIKCLQQARGTCVASLMVKCDSQLAVN